jgi:hypothetical protein
MQTTKMYEGRAVMIDPSSYPLGLETKDFIFDFITAANEECNFFLPPDWYVVDYDEDSRTIVVSLDRYASLMNMQPLWNFVLTADPIDEDEMQWVEFDVVRCEPSKVYKTLQQ